MSSEIYTFKIYIFNLLLTTGIFPDRAKVAKVTPIFKKAEKCSISNYRPISVLLCFSKILEQIMYNKLSLFYCFNILLNKQFRFRASHSNEHALLELIDMTCRFIKYQKLFFRNFH